MSIELKIKAVSLADEARTIRREEKAAKARRDTQTVNKLHMHRVGIVREEARATHLARAYLAGRAYREIEATTRCPLPAFIIKKVVKMLERYGGLSEPDLSEWLAQPKMKQAA